MGHAARLTGLSLTFSLSVVAKASRSTFGKKRAILGPLRGNTFDASYCVEAYRSVTLPMENPAGGYLELIMLHVTRIPLPERNNEKILADIVARLESVGFVDVGYDVLQPKGTVVWWADRIYYYTTGAMKEQRATSIQWAGCDKTELLSHEQFCDMIVCDLAQRLRDLGE